MQNVAIIESDNILSDEEELRLSHAFMPFTLSLKIRDFENEAEAKKYIKNCEKLLRSCLEYRLWKNYIIDVLGMRSCFITDELASEVTIEIHHHIPSLYILISSIINKKIDDKEEFCTLDIAFEAIKLHFLNKIGYVILVKTIHEKFHNGFLTIPVSLVKGDYRHFLDNYSRYIEEDDLNILNERMSVNESNCTWSKDKY